MYFLDLNSQFARKEVGTLERLGTRGVRRRLSNVGDEKISQGLPSLEVAKKRNGVKKKKKENKD